MQGTERPSTVQSTNCDEGLDWTLAQLIHTHLIVSLIYLLTRRMRELIIWGYMIAAQHDPQAPVLANLPTESHCKCRPDYCKSEGCLSYIA